MNPFAPPDGKLRHLAAGGVEIYNAKRGKWLPVTAHKALWKAKRKIAKGEA